MPRRTKTKRSPATKSLASNPALCQRDDFNLSSYEDFLASSSIQALIPRFQKDAVTAKHVVETVANDLTQINTLYRAEKKRGLLSTVDYRVKSQDSFFLKLFKICKASCQTQGFDEEKLESWYNSIHDVAGVRFSCPYYDEVEMAIREYIRPALENNGYGTNLDDTKIPDTDKLPDRDYLDKGDANGYRSYHFFLKVPTKVDIYGHIKVFVCEVQGRSELQQVWAVKSHDLLYKPTGRWVAPDSETIKDMQELSNNLRSVDHFLSQIRKRLRKE